MIPLNPSRLFRSRWRALWWSASVLAGVVVTIGLGAPKAGDAPQVDALGQSVSDANLKALAAVMNDR